MTSNCDDTRGLGTGDTPIMLTDIATKSLRFRDRPWLWGNTGFSLLPVAVLTRRRQPV